jgi:5-methylcytosine-specific restriction endonuclease McrA
MSLLFPITDYPVAPPVSVNVWRCDHRYEVRRFVISSGAVRYCPECQVCHGRNPYRSYGRKRAMKEFGLTEAEIDALPDVDHKAKDAWEYARMLESIARQKRRRGEWWAWYNEYLLSPEWYARRLAVLKRDGNKCRACQDDASQVHHLTYERVGKEPLEDLVAICDGCHERLHQRVVPE